MLLRLCLIRSEHFHRGDLIHQSHAAVVQTELQLYRERTVSLEWQLRIAVPEKSIRQLIAAQSEEAKLQGDTAAIFG